jgi:hypothetical protein
MAIVTATFQKCGSFNSWMSVKVAVPVSHAVKITTPTYEILAVATAGSKQ